MNFFILLLSTFFWTSAFANESFSCDGALQTHLSEAMAHNKKAALRYGKLTKGNSLHLSFSLIKLEFLSKELVKKLDSDSQSYHQNGIKLLCEELGDMNEIPEFQDRLDEQLRPTQYYPYNNKKFSDQFLALINKNKLAEAYHLVSSDLINLENYPNQQCLTRHFLESIASTLKFSTEQREKASALGLSDPLPLIKRYLTLQNTGLTFTHLLDAKAFPLQKSGLLIFCQDVPPINWK